MSAPGLIIVGESNPYGCDPMFALYHLPRNASGDRLRRIMGLTDEQYHDLCRVNLCDGEWSLKDARERAATLLESCYRHVFVACGARVATAFRPRVQSERGRMVREPVLPFTSLDEINMHRVLALPHPSGRCRAWNATTIGMARSMLRDAVPGIRWGMAGDAFHGTLGITMNDVSLYR